jgi:ubiquinone/menaquinone biosynthesis C-methylase UbiE
MVLEARPLAILVALDLFADSFEQHFGPSQSPRQRLLANLKTAGVEQRATIVTADMRKLPFDGGAFDAIGSAYAIDHLDRRGVSQSLAEAARVVKPGGEFLAILVDSEPWSRVCLRSAALATADYALPSGRTHAFKRQVFRFSKKECIRRTLYVLARRL